MEPSRIPLPDTTGEQSSITPRLEIPIPNVEFSSAVTGDGTLTVPFLAEYAAGVYQFLLSIVGVVGGVFIIVGGYMYLTAGGSAERTAAGKKRIVNAVLGLTLAYGSYLILFTINPGLVKFEALRFSAVKTELFIDPAPSEKVDQDLTDLENEEIRNGKGCCSTNAVPLIKQGWYPDTPYLDETLKCRTQPTGKNAGEIYSIKSSGCGVTSAAMLTTYLTGISVSPVTMATLSTANKHRSCNDACDDCNGTSYKFYSDEKTIGIFGLEGKMLGWGGKTGKESSSDYFQRKQLLENRIMQLLGANRPVIVSVKKSIFTNGGHFILLTGLDQNGYIMVNDPSRSTYKWSDVQNKQDTSRYENLFPIKDGHVPKEFIFPHLNQVHYVYKKGNYLSPCPSCGSI